jgi:hypothetical protein
MRKKTTIKKNRLIIIIAATLGLLMFGGAAYINTSSGSSISDADQAFINAAKTECIYILDRDKSSSMRAAAQRCVNNLNNITGVSGTTTSTVPTTTNTVAPTTTVAPVTTTTNVPVTTVAPTTTVPAPTTTIPATNGKPPASGYFTTSAPGSALPSEATCAAQVRRSSWEPRPNNNSASANTHAGVGANSLKPPAGFTFSNNLDFGSLWNLQKNRVTGNFTGTTDEILQWAACKWGWSDNWVRAQMVQETNWNQVGSGSWGDRISATTTPPCPPDSLINGTFYLGRDSSSCPQSFGLLQNKYRYQPTDAYPWYRTSTAFALDYSLWKLRGCWEGVKNGSTVKGDINLCWANWWSGAWSTSVSYDDSVNNYLNSKPWLNW